MCAICSLLVYEEKAVKFSYYIKKKYSVCIIVLHFTDCYSVEFLSACFLKRSFDQSQCSEWAYSLIFIMLENALA